MKKPHYSWAICLGCTLMLLVCTGLCVNTFSVTQPYVLEYNGFTNTQTSMIGTIRAVSFLICMLLTPVFYRKSGYRTGMTAACLLVVLAFVMFAFARSIAVYYAAAVIAGSGYGFGSMVPATILISRWFRQRKGLALGICAAGTGLATVAFSPLLSAIVERSTLKLCFLFEALVCLILAILVFLLVRDDPASCGKTPYGEEAAKTAAGTDTVCICPSKLLWVLLYISMCMIGALAASGFTHMMILFTTAGFAPSRAALAVSVFGLALMTGKCVFGYVCDRLGSYRSNYVFGSIMLLGLVLCIFANLQSEALMFAAAALFGFGAPISTVGLSVWAGDFSTAETFSHRVQLFQLCYGIGALAFGTVPGVIADRFGSYVPTYILFFIMGIGSMLVVQITYLTGHRKKR